MVYQEHLNLIFYKTGYQNFLCSSQFVVVKYKTHTCFTKLHSKCHQQCIPGEATLYLSIGSVLEEEQMVQQPVTLLNNLELPNVPLHKLDLKVPVMLLQSLEALRLFDQSQQYEGIKAKSSRKPSSSLDVPKEIIFSFLEF